MKAGSLGLLVLGLVVGLATGYLFGRGAGAPSLDRPDSAPRRAGAESRGPAGPEVAAGPGAARAGGTARAGPAAAGSGRIEVYVRTSEGGPLPGVEVRARPTEETAGNPCYEAATGEDGFAALDGLPAGRFRVAGYLAGWRIEGGGGRVDPDRAAPGDRVILEAARTFGVPILVRGPDGTTLERADITGRQGNETERRNWFRETGTISLGPGTWRLKAAAGEDGELRSEEVEVTVHPEGGTPPAVLVVEPRPGLHGRVIYPAEGEAYSVWIYAFPVEPDAPADAPIPAAARSRAQVSSRADPEYSIPDLEPGTWLVAAVDLTGKDLVRRLVTIADRTVPLDLPVPKSTVSDHLDLVVLDPGGARLTDVSVSVGYETDSGGAWQSSGSEVLPDGRIRVAHFHPDREELKDGGGKFTLTVNSPKYGEQRMEYDPRKSSELTVRFDEPATVEVTLVGLPTGAARRSLVVQLQPVDGGHFADGSEGEIDETGKAVVGPVPPGRYELTVGIRRLSYYSPTPFFRKPLTLDRGRIRETIDLPRFGSLTVLVGEDRKDRKFGLSRNSIRDQWLGTSEVAPSDGRVVFDLLAPGEYRISTRGPDGFESMLVAVDGDTTVRFAPAPLDALRVRITDDGGALASAGFRDGDLVVAIAGTEIRNGQQARALRAAARDGGATPVTVLRGGKTLELRFDFSRADDPSAAGGAFLSASR